MTWHVQYTCPDGVAAVVRFSTPERAIEEACKLLDADCDVYGIGTGPLTDSIDRAQIDRIYHLWKRTRRR